MRPPDGQHNGDATELSLEENAIPVARILPLKGLKLQVQR